MPTHNRGGYGTGTLWNTVERGHCMASGPHGMVELCRMMMLDTIINDCILTGLAMGLAVFVVQVSHDLCMRDAIVFHKIYNRQR